MLPKENRLVKSGEIERVIRWGHSFFSQHAGIKFIKTPHYHPRLVIIVSLKISKQAVIRNKLKRQIRVILSGLLSNIKEGYDIIILTRPILVNLTYQKLGKEIRYLFGQAGLLKSDLHY